MSPVQIYLSHECNTVSQQPCMCTLVPNTTHRSLSRYVCCLNGTAYSSPLGVCTWMTKFCCAFVTLLPYSAGQCNLLGMHPTSSAGRTEVKVLTRFHPPTHMWTSSNLLWGRATVHATTTTWLGFKVFATVRATNVLMVSTKHQRPIYVRAECGGPRSKSR